LAERYAKWYGKPDTATQSTCIFCEAACALGLATNSGKLVTAKAVNEDVPVCVLGRFAIPEFLNGTDRLSMPDVRVGEVLRQTEWEQILESTAGKLKEFLGDSFAMVCDTTSTLEDRHIFKKFTNKVMKSKNYIELQPDARGVSHTSLPKGTRAALLTGNFVDSANLDGLELLIVQDCYPSAVSERADIVLPAAVFAEISGTMLDGSGQKRPLHKACEPPGQAKAEWWIISSLARAMGAKGFAYESAGAITRELGISAELSAQPKDAPTAATNAKLRRTFFRGHRINEKVLALQELPVDDTLISPKVESKRTDGFEILEKSEISPNIHEIVIKAPNVGEPSP
jgi:anaerobic selenocysteine-containing dehydrogenase